MMKLSIVQGNDKQAVWVKITLDGFEPFWFQRNAASEIESVLLSDRLHKELRDQIEQIRRVSYLRGWHEAKSKKRPKSDCFAGCFDVLD